MDDRGPTNVIPFPAHRRGTIEDTLSGFPASPSAGARFGERSERAVSMLFVELRGWRTITERVGATGAEDLLSRVVGRALETVAEHGAEDLTLLGEPMQPVLSCSFSGSGHALRALQAAAAVRDAAAKVQFPAMPGHQYQACAGVDSGSIVEAQLGGDPTLRFRAVGTIELFASRLQEFAGPGQVFLSTESAALAGPAARVRSIGEVRVNAAGERREAFLLHDVSGPGSERPTAPWAHR